MNKLLIMLTLILVLNVSGANATDYLIEDGDYFSTVSLFNNDTLLMTGGTGELLTQSDSSVATIENTKSLGNVSGDGGIWEVGVGGFSILNLYGGEINEIETYNESIINITGGSVNTLEMYYKSMSYLYGGSIGTLASDQPSGYPLPQNWIHVYCLEYDHDSNNNILTGLWGDGSPFSIQLDDIGAIPTYEQIEFHIIPEPATGFLLLAGLFGLLVKKNKQTIV